MKYASLFTAALAAAVATVPVVSHAEGSFSFGSRELVGSWACFRTTSLPAGAADGFISSFHDDGTFIAHGDVNSATTLMGVYRQDAPNHFLTLGKSFLFNLENPNGVATTMRISRGKVKSTSYNTLAISLAFTVVDFSNNVLGTTGADFSCTRTVIDFTASTPAP
jgi:hypothetical protein